MTLAREPLEHPTSMFFVHGLAEHFAPAFGQGIASHKDRRNPWKIIAIDKLPDSVGRFSQR